MVLTEHSAGAEVALPHMSEPILDRPRLRALLRDGFRRNITLVCGPPGAGKTTLVAGWAHRAQERRIGWLTVEPADNRPDHFAWSVVAALEEVGAVPSHAVSSSGDGASILHAALRAVALHREPIALVLDDLQELTAPEALLALGVLVDNVPPSLDLVLVSRADPPLRLWRLRLDGRLGDIRNVDLLFRRAEAAELFENHGLRVTDQDMTAIHAQSEGWAAGLRLMALAVEHGADAGRLAANTNAAEGAVSDYLLTEVLSREDETMQQFLLRTSVVDRLTPELAVVLADDPGAGTQLEELQRRGLFLTEMEGAAVYRYHALFAALLRARLRHQDPALLRELHARAATWYAAHELPGDAEDHARHAEDWPLLGALVRRRWMAEVLAGLEQQDRLIIGIPEDAIVATPALGLVAAADAIRLGDRDAADAYLWHVPAVPTDPRYTASLSEAEIATLVVDMLHGRAFGPGQRSVAAIDRLVSADAGTDPLLGRFARLCRAEVALDEGDLDGAQLELAQLARDDSCWTGRNAVAYLALVHAVEGRLRAGESLANQFILGPAPSHHPTVSTAATIALSLVLAQRGQPAAARSTIDSAVAAPASRALRAVRRSTQAALHATPFHGGPDGSSARHPLAQRALVALGVFETIDAAGGIVAIGGPAEAAVERGRRTIAAGSHIGTIGDLDAWLGDQSHEAHPRTLIEASVLATIAALGCGDHPAARGHLAHALDEATPEGSWAPVLAHVPRISAALEATAREAGPGQQAAILMLDEARRAHAPAFLQPLTDQERAVLGFLPTMMSNTEISEAMHLSVNTVKTHLKSLYRKLGVERRRDAVLQARQLELL